MNSEKLSVARQRVLRDRFAAENPNSHVLSKRMHGLLAGGVNHDVRRADPFAVAVERAEGSRKWDVDGHEIVCYVMGHGSLLHGHSRPEVVDAVHAQAKRFFHPGACHELEAEWAEAVVSLVPSAELVRFTSSGSEASLLALRIARAVTGRPRVLKLAGHFHGWHDQVSFGADAPFTGPDSAGVPEELGVSVLVCPAELVAISEGLAGGDVAAVILEPSGASWGSAPLPHGFLQEVRRVTSEARTLLVFDEVITGFRWSPGGIQQLANVWPDLTVLGKILAGGMPGGCVAGRADVMDALSDAAPSAARVKHPGTHNAHPLSAAAGVAALALVAQGESLTVAADLAEELRAGLNAVLVARGVAGRAYGDSSTFHMLLGTDQDPATLDLAQLKAGMPTDVSAELSCGMLLGGVHLFHSSGFLSGAHNQDDAERTVAAFDFSVTTMQAEGLLL